MINPFRRWARRNRDLDDEIAMHMQLAIADRVARGETADEAAASVRREFGSPALVKEVTRSMWRGAWFDRLNAEFRVAFRTLWRTPRFSIAAIACLAIGIGTTSTIFSALHAILLRPLPYPNAASLVSIDAVNEKAGSAGASITSAELELWRHTQTLDRIAAWRLGYADLTGAEELPERVLSADVDPHLLAMLGVHPMHGRWFDESEAAEGANRVVILGHDLWQRRFGSDTSLIGRQIQLGGGSVRVVGVMPPAFNFPDGAKVWRPLVPPRLPPDILFFSGALGSLPSGRSILATRREFAQFDRELNKSPAYAGWTTSVQTLRDHLVGPLRKPIYVFQAAALLVLLTACANVAALLLARGLARETELRVRSALGASRRHLVGHVLVECFAIAAIGGLIGVALAFVGLPLLGYAFPDGVPSYIDLTVRAPTVLVSLGIAMAAALAVGIVPALRAGAHSGPLLHQASRSAGANVAAGKRRLNALVAGELAVSVVLLIGATLLVTTHDRLQQGLGFQPAGLLSTRVALPFSAYRTETERDAFFRRFEERLRATPGVVDVGVSVMAVPLDGPGTGTFHFRLASQAAGHAPVNQRTTTQYVTPEYLELLRVPVLRGVGLPSESDNAERVGVVNETFANRYFGHDAVLNQQIVIGPENRKSSAPIRIVGVIRDFREERPPAEIKPAVYLNMVSGAFARTFLVGTRLPEPGALAPILRAVLRDMDSRLVADKLQTQVHLVNRAFWRERMESRAIAICAALAVLLSVCGLYGVLSYAVAQRTTELGIRLAIGASARDLIGIVLGQAARIAMWGIAIGVAASLLLTRALASLLYGVVPVDVTILAGSALLVLVVALAAALIPALRASRLDPLSAIRLG